MKKCEQIKDLILTNYMDGQLDLKLRQGVEEHLLDCRDCRAFFKEIKNHTVLPFHQGNPQPVPAQLWSNIKESLAEDQQPALGQGLVEALKDLFVFPRLVPMLASLVVMLMAGTVSLNTIQEQHLQDKDQGEYLVSLLGKATAAATETIEPSTPIEHYFL